MLPSYTEVSTIQKELFKTNATKASFGQKQLNIIPVAKSELRSEASASGGDWGPKKFTLVVVKWWTHLS